MTQGAATRLAGDSRGRYELREQLQPSATGNLWRAWDHERQRDVDIRQLRAPDALAPLQQRLVLQHRAQAALRVRGSEHPGLVPVVDVLTSDDEVLVVLDAVHGEWLSDVLRRDGRLDPQRAAAVGAGLARTLASLHAGGLVHGDLRPSRVVTSGRDVWLVAYGLEAFGGEAVGTLLASPAYLSPQRAQGAAAAPADDLWALGVLLHAMVEGSAPFGGHSVDEVLDAAASRPAPECTGCPPALAQLVAALLEKDPARRPAAATAAQRLTELAAPPAAEPAEPAPRPTARPSARPAQPRERGVLVPLLGVVILIAICWFVLSHL